MSDDFFEPTIQYEFVDRIPQRDQFHEFAAIKEYRRILCVQAEDGWGKSWLLSRLYMEIPTEACLKVIVDLGSPEAENEMAILELIAEKMGGAISDHMKEVLKTPSGTIHAQAARDLSVGGDVVAGSKVIVQNYGGAEHVSVELKDLYEYENRVRVGTRLFKFALAQLQPPMRGILFFDRFEKATEPTRRWLINSLFTGLRQNSYKNLLIVIASSQPFDCFRERGWHLTTLYQQLGGLPEEAIREYWIKIRNLPETSLEGILETLRKEGNSPLVLSLLAEKFEQAA
jgi:hypothetical protein